MANRLQANVIFMSVMVINFLFAACNRAGETTSGASAPPNLEPVLVMPVSAQANLTAVERIRLGKIIYATHCAACHQLNGEGNLRLFPALNHNALVLAGDPTAVIDTVLHGRQEMPAFAPILTDQQLAAVVSYIRNAWDNQTFPVTPEKVQEVRSLPSIRGRR